MAIASSLSRKGHARMTSPRLQTGQTLLPFQHQQHRILPHSQHRCPYQRVFQPTAAQRFFDIRIQSSWGSGASSSQSTEAVGSRWWSANRENEQEEKKAEAEQHPPGTDRWSNLFSNNKDTTSATYSASNSSNNYGYSSTYSSSHSSQVNSSEDSSSKSVTSAVDTVAPWVLIALVPTILWSITWCFTGGMVTLANTSMTGMCSVARLLYPSLPVRGVDYEDVAVSLVKALHTDTDLPSTWTRPGLLAPGWLLRGAMMTMFNLATASSSVASVLIPSQQVLLVSGISQGLMYFICLLLMMPLGAGLSSLAQQGLQLMKQYNIQLPTAPKLPFSVPKLTDSTALALKLAGVLAWPCISAAAVLQPSLMAQHNFTASFTVAGLQVLSCTLLLVLLLAVAVLAGRFAVHLGKRQASTDMVLDFGFHVGVLCAVAGGLNLAQIGLGLTSGLLAPSQLAMPVVSTLILARVVWSVWRLYRIGTATPSIWLQLLTLTPEPKAPMPASNSS